MRHLNQSKHNKKQNGPFLHIVGSKQWKSQNVLEEHNIKYSKTSPTYTEVQEKLFVPNEMHQLSTK
jgi:hypothetical protein